MGGGNEKQLQGVQNISPKGRKPEPRSNPTEMDYITKDQPKANP